MPSIPGYLSVGGFSFTIQSGSLTSGMMASGFIFFLNNAATLTSGQVTSGFIGDAAIVSGSIASGQLSRFNFSSGAIGSGQVGNNAITSGNIASGQIGDNHLSSGAIITMARVVAPLHSGSPIFIVTEEMVSGCCAVHLSPSGHIRIAMASVSGRMPAMGVVLDDTLSGLKANVYAIGEFQPIAGDVDFSGYIGAPVFVGRSGQIATQSGSWTSGGFLSGDILQQVGTTVTSGALIINVSVPYVSGGPPVLTSGITQSGNIASGVISQFKMASGAVNSGHVGSGAVAGQAGGGAFNIVFGSINNFDIGSGGVLSGNIASGQVGVFHHASGSVRSGSIASGQVGQFALASGAVNSGQINIGGTPDGTKFFRDDFTWQAAGGGGSLTSGAVGSGFIASGTVQGFYGTTRHIASGTVGVFDLGSGAVVAGTVGSGAIVSGSFASGQISQFKLASGAVNSGQINLAGAPDGTQFFRDDFTWAQVPATTLTSGSVQSGHIASGAVKGFFGPTRNVSSGTIGVFDFGSGAVIVGAVGSGAIGSGQIASGNIGPFHFASGAVQSGSIGSGAVLGQAGAGAFTIASGTIGTFDIGSGAVQSGRIASGQIGSYAFASGAVIDRSQYSLQYVSGIGRFTVITEEGISGVRAVCLSQSGNLRVAMASVSGRMPAVGVVLDNVASGIQANVFTAGPQQFTSGLGDYSGYLGSVLFVGRSGQIVTLSGSFNSGGFLSGDIWQPVATVINSGAINVDAACQLPFVVSQVLSGNIGSGQVSSGHLTSGLMQYATWQAEAIATTEQVSGFKAVCLTSGGFIALAMAGSGLRLPAIGIVDLDFVSGATAYVIRGDRVMVRSGLDSTWSGMAGKHLYVGSGGMVVTQSGLQSGAGWQSVGTAVSGGLLVNVSQVILSGAYTSPAGAF